MSELPGGELRLSFEPLPPDLAHGALRVEDAQAVLAVLDEALQQAAASPPRTIVLAAKRWGSAAGTRSAWEERLRAEFIARYGPPLLPLPEVLEKSRLYMALKVSPRYMGAGFRGAAQELFQSPVFRASVALSILVYFAAWTVPEPFFSKSFAAALTVRLALLVGALELRHVALACLRLYEEAEAATTVEELEAVAERFGRAVGGTGLRVLVMVASFGVGRALPRVPPGGLLGMMGPPRYAVAGGLTMGASMTAHAVADGTLVVAGAAMGTAASSAQGDAGAACTDGTQKKDGYRWHHLATDKNDTSTARGGPWTPLFEELFARAGMGLGAAENRVYLRAHQGPHPQAYHEEVFQRLQQALALCRTTEQCRTHLVRELRMIARDVCTPGTRLHRLLTQARAEP
ncbi:AHH domain-containing protein [Hyalangium rubrum]|uniref:AHH domain-containing protein n=1 Tax=Hyalangium rubrum TaxID=3103134 RepID=A0ABU5HCM6_9BACT|nr:AHH domain-containing protein [Hyalangium sp. s54d21]MDY7230859.1 AHH domain-containing protein [Hyalangium sp. s54d21]